MMKYEILVEEREQEEEEEYSTGQMHYFFALYSRHTFIIRVSLLFHSFYHLFRTPTCCYAADENEKSSFIFSFLTTKLCRKKISCTHSTSLSYRSRGLNMRVKNLLLILRRGTGASLLKTYDMYNVLCLLFHDLHAHKQKFIHWYPMRNTYKWLRLYLSFVACIKNESWETYKIFKDNHVTFHLSFFYWMCFFSYDVMWDYKNNQKAFYSVPASATSFEHKFGMSLRDQG